MQYLILGANGYIGAYLYRRMHEDGLTVFGTCRKRTGNADLLYFDLRNSSLDVVMDKITDTEKVVIICIAEANIDRCLVNREEAYQVNVVSMKAVIHQLVMNGFRVIFFSSDNVFNGEEGGYTEESGTSPINEYGKMKAEMEEYLLENEPEVCILRISKVVSMQKKKQNVFTDWMKRIDDGVIRCIQGNYMSFVSIEDVYQACLIVSERRLHGLYNIAGEKAYSRAELAEEFCRKLGVLGVDIREYALSEFNFKDNRPLNVSMSNQKFKNETGYQFMEMDNVIEKFIRCGMK